MVMALRSDKLPMMVALVANGGHEWYTTACFFTIGARLLDIRLAGGSRGV